MQQALGMVETRGVTTAVEAMDTMLKSATVRVSAVVTVGAGIVTVFVEGDVGSVKTAVEAGIQSAQKLGEVRCVHVIPRPHEELVEILKQSLRNDCVLQL